MACDYHSIIKSAIIPSFSSNKLLQRVEKDTFANNHCVNARKRTLTVQQNHPPSPDKLSLLPIHNETSIPPRHT